MAMKLVVELDSAGNLSKHLYVVSVYSEHLVRYVRLGVYGTLFMVIEHVDGDAAGGGAGVHKEPWLVGAEKVMNVRLRIGEGGRVSL